MNQKHGHTFRDLSFHRAYICESADTSIKDSQPMLNNGSIFGNPFRPRLERMAAVGRVSLRNVDGPVELIFEIGQVDIE